MGGLTLKRKDEKKGTFLIFVLFAVLLTVCSSKQKEATHNETMIIKPSEFSEETKDLILEKAKFEDWETMYKNVWSRSEAALYMQWRVTESEAAARECIRKTIRFLYKGIIIKHNKTEPTYTKTSLFLCEKRRFFMARTEKGVVTTI